jgi:hypothetical protein
LAAEYETILAAANADKWAAMIANSGLTEAQIEAVMDSDVLGLLGSELRRAETLGQPVEALLRAAVRRGELDTANDIAAVLRRRVQMLNDDSKGASRTRQPNLIVGLIPAATGTFPPEWQEALKEREQAMVERANTLVRQAVADGEPWLQELGPRPTDRARAALWNQAAQAAVAYRDRYEVTGPSMLGVPTDFAQRHNAARVRAILASAAQAPVSEPATAPARSQGPVL